MSVHCPHCERLFTRHDNMLRHVNSGKCKKLPPSTGVTNVDVEIIKKELCSLREQTSNEIAELKEVTARIANKSGNQILQVMCVTGNDNYLDMLTDKFGDFTKAIEYVRDCALSDVVGDCKLISNSYSKTTDCDQLPNMYYVDHKHSKIAYYNDKNERIVESKVAMGIRLANNLQKSYLKGVNFLINRNLECRLCPNKFLENYDLMTWNEHIYKLSDDTYQKKIISRLNIPTLQEKIDQK
jgi:hypothetical protein